MVSWDGCIHKDAGVCFTVYPNMSVETLCKKKSAILSASSIHVVSPSDSILKVIYESNNNFQTQPTRPTFVLHFRLYISPQLSTFE